MLGLFAFYAVRGWSLQALAEATPGELAFLTGARALYYEEQAALIRAGVAGGVSMLLPGGDGNGE